MTSQHFTWRSRIPASAEAAFAWHTRPGAFESLTPPWEKVRVISRSGGLEDGSEVRLETRIGPAATEWVARHSDVIPGRFFRDVQVTGPFVRWEHSHQFIPDGSAFCFMEDQIDYQLPGGRMGEALGGTYVRRSLERLFRYRHEVLTHSLEEQQRWGMPPLNIAITGASGFVGSALSAWLGTAGHRVIPVRRPQVRGIPGGLTWDLAGGGMDPGGVERMDAVIHLAGENIAQRWSPAVKDRIRQSRVSGTRALAGALAGLPDPPRVFVCASAIGFYGSRDSDLLDENSACGTGFFAELGRDWEEAARPAAEAGIRVVNLRLGLVLSAAAGALGKMLPAFRAGLGGRLSDGKAWWSWIALDDALAAIHCVLANEALSGPVNLVSPNPVSNAEFTRVLGRVLGRPTVLPLPRVVLDCVFGEMAREAMLASVRVRPAKLIQAGFQFRHPELEGALRHLTGRMMDPQMRGHGTGGRLIHR